MEVVPERDSRKRRIETFRQSFRGKVPKLLEEAMLSFGHSQKGFEKA